MNAETHIESAPPVSRLRSFIERDGVQALILSVIIANAITLGLTTSESLVADYGPLLIFLDKASYERGFGRVNGVMYHGASTGVHDCEIRGPVPIHHRLDSTRLALGTQLRTLQRWDSA